MSECSDNNDDESYEYQDEDEEEENEEDDHLLMMDDCFVKDSSSGKFVKKELADTDVVMSTSTLHNCEEITELVSAGLDARSIVDSYQGRFVARTEDDSSWSRVSDQDALSFVQSIISISQPETEKKVTSFDEGYGAKRNDVDHEGGGDMQDLKVEQYTTEKMDGDDLPALLLQSTNRAHPAEIVESEQAAGDDFSAVTMAHGDWDDASIATANQHHFDDESWDLMSRMSALESSSQQSDTMQMLDFSSIASMSSHQTSGSSYMMPPASVKSIMSDYSSVAISTWSMVDGKVPCKRCTFLNEPGTQLCTVCDFALDANPSLTIDEQLAMQMQRREDASRGINSTHRAAAGLMCMDPLEGAQDIADKLFRFIKLHNLEMHVFARQLDLEFLISSSWLRGREELLRALENTNTQQQDIVSSSAQVLKARLAAKASLESGRSLVERIEAAATGNSSHGKEESMKDLKKSTEVDVAQLFHKWARGEHETSHMLQSPPVEGKEIAQDSKDGEMVKAAAEVEVAQTHESCNRDLEHGALHNEECPQIESSESAQESGGIEDDEIASTEAIAENRASIEAIAEESANVMPWLAYTTSTEDPQKLATNGFSLVNTVEIYTEAPTRLGEISPKCDDAYPHVRVWLCAVILGNATTNFELGTREGELKNVTAARTLLKGNRKIILRSGAQCLPLLCLRFSQWVEGGKIPALTNELQRSVFGWTSGNLWEAAVNAADMEELQNDVIVQDHVTPWSGSNDSPIYNENGFQFYGYDNNTQDATATTEVPRTPSEFSHAQQRWVRKGFGTSRPFPRKAAQPRQQLSDPNIFTIKEHDYALQGTVEATRAEHVLVYFKQGQLVSTLIEGVIKLRAVECPNEFIVRMEGVDVYGVKANPKVSGYTRPFATATHDTTKYIVKVPSLSGQLPLLSYSCHQKKVFQSDLVPLKLEIATRNIREHNVQILPSSSESSDGVSMKEEVGLEIHCASNLHGFHIIHDLQIEIDYSGTSLQLKSCNPDPSVAHIMGPKKPVFRVNKAFEYGEACKIDAVFSHETPMLPSATFKIKAWFSTTTWNATDSKLVIESKDEYRVSKNHVTTVVHTEEWRHECTPS